MERYIFHQKIVFIFRHVRVEDIVEFLKYVSGCELSDL